MLAPISFLSAYDPPIPAPFPAFVKLRLFGPGVMRSAWNLGKRASMEWVRPVTEFRRELGLPILRPGHPIFEGAHSPDLVLALFSHIMADPQPDWPKHDAGYRLSLCTTVRAKDCLAAIEDFLEKGPPPIVFTLGLFRRWSSRNVLYGQLRSGRNACERGPSFSRFASAGFAGILARQMCSRGRMRRMPRCSKRPARRTSGRDRDHSPGIACRISDVDRAFAHDQFDNAEEYAGSAPRLSYPDEVQRSFGREGVAALCCRRVRMGKPRRPRQPHIDAENGAETAAFAIDKYVGRNRTGC